VSRRQRIANPAVDARRDSELCAPRSHDRGCGCASVELLPGSVSLTVIVHLPLDKAAVNLHPVAA
jgi:hypothetical protein